MKRLSLGLISQFALVTLTLTACGTPEAASEDPAALRVEAAAGSFADIAPIEASQESLPAKMDLEGRRGGSPETQICTVSAAPYPGSHFKTCNIRCCSGTHISTTAVAPGQCISWGTFWCSSGVSYAWWSP